MCIAGIVICVRTGVAYVVSDTIRELKDIDDEFERLRIVSEQAHDQADAHANFLAVGSLDTIGRHRRSLERLIVRGALTVRRCVCVFACI